MPKSKEQVKYYITLIRRLMIAKRDISEREIVDQFAQNKITIDREYAGKLRNKILIERTHRLNRVFLNYRLAEQDDARQEVLSRSWDIIFKQPVMGKDKDGADVVLIPAPSNSTKLQAMQMILHEEHGWTNLLVDLGVFNKGDDRAKRFIPASDEKIAEMVEAFKAHLSPEANPVKYIDAIVKEIKPKQDEHTATTPATGDGSQPDPNAPGTKQLADGSTVTVRFGLGRG